MAKNRMIRTEIWTDDKFVSLSPMARLLFIGMWHLACDYGHVSESPIELKMRVFPMDPLTVEEMRGLVEEIQTQGLIEARGSHLAIPNFEKHQRLDKRYMTTCAHCGATRDHDGATREPDVSTTGTRRAPASSHDEREREREREREGGAGGRRKRATPAPESLDITEDMKTWAKEKAPLVDLDEATEEFITWARSVDKRYSDWPAAWRNAMKRRQEWASRDGRHLRAVGDDRPDWMLA